MFRSSVYLSRDDNRAGKKKKFGGKTSFGAKQIAFKMAYLRNASATILAAITGFYSVLFQLQGIRIL